VSGLQVPAYLASISVEVVQVLLIGEELGPGLGTLKKKKEGLEGLERLERLRWLATWGNWDGWGGGGGWDGGDGWREAPASSPRRR